MTKKILAAVDLAHAGAGVLDMAHEIAERHHAELTILTVLPSIPAYVDAFMPAQYQDEAEKKALQGLKDRLMEKGWGEDRYRFVVRHGVPYDVVIAEAAKTGADLIVIGSHAPTAADYLLGSTASKVVRHAKCSVYIVRQSETG